MGVDPSVDGGQVLPKFGVEGTPLISMFPPPKLLTVMFICAIIF